MIEQKPLEENLDAEIKKEIHEIKKDALEALNLILPRYRPKQSRTYFRSDNDHFYEFCPNGQIIRHFILIDHDADRTVSSHEQNLDPESMIRALNDYSLPEIVSFYQEVRANVADSESIHERIKAGQLEDRQAKLKDYLLANLEQLLPNFKPRCGMTLDYLAEGSRPGIRFYNFNYDGTVDFIYPNYEKGDDFKSTHSSRRMNTPEVISALKRYPLTALIRACDIVIGEIRLARKLEEIK